MPVIRFNPEPDDEAQPGPFTWRDYESSIKEILAQKFPGSSITSGAYLPGYFSKVRRQVDILVEGELVGKPLVGVIECKYFSRKVNVKVVDGFIGFLEDVRANLGIIITNIGYTDAASNRADLKNIHLDVVNFDQLDEYEPPLWDICEVCDPDPDIEEGRPWISWGYRIDEDLPFDIGTCQHCRSINVRCHHCGSVTGLTDSDYDRPVDCAGQCGMRFLADPGWGSDR